MFYLYSSTEVPHVTILFGILISPTFSPASASPSAERHDLSFPLPMGRSHQVRGESAAWDPLPRFPVVRHGEHIGHLFRMNECLFVRYMPPFTGRESAMCDSKLEYLCRQLPEPLAYDRLLYGLALKTCTVLPCERSHIPYLSLMHKLLLRT